MYCILSVLNQVWENYGQKQAYYLSITVLEYSIYIYIYILTSQPHPEPWTATEVVLSFSFMFSNEPKFFLMASMSAP